ncbi:MAG: hypothetical protein MUE51_14970 [Thermoleophilia bacterium]|nr:hypothetical protein [Thermoleophilia bacterium]
MDEDKPGIERILAAAGRGRFNRVYRYGDVSQAAYGRRDAGPAVAAAAQHNPDFPCAPHIVPSDWTLTDAFRSPLGDGRAVWIARLRADGVRVTDEGVVPEQYWGHWTDLLSEAEREALLHTL